MRYTQRLILFFFFIILISCQSEDEKEKLIDYSIKWNSETLTCIAEEGFYPRMHRINDNSLILVYENGRGDVMLKRSLNEGSSWSEPTIIYESFEFRDQDKSTKINIANPEFIQLNNGDLLLACNLRPSKDGIYPFSIALKMSADNGDTWSQEQIVYEASTIFSDGCWEPSFLVLPDGTVQLYFANEYPYNESDEQEISMLSSNDSGKTWSSEVTTVSFRKGHRDGMPVAVLDGDLIAVAIEDNVTGQFHPYIVRSKITDSWSKPITGASDNRHNALENPLQPEVYAGAPYFIKTDIGVYVLSYQTTNNRTSNWEKSTMEVVVSNTTDNFKNPSHPFNVPLGKEAKWNSITDLGKGEIAALSSTNFQSDRVGIWMIKGQILKK